MAASQSAAFVKNVHAYPHNKMPQSITLHPSLPRFRRHLLRVRCTACAFPHIPDFVNVSGVQHIEKTGGNRSEVEGEDVGTGKADELEVFGNRKAYGLQRIIRSAVCQAGSVVVLTEMT